jgi:hypothetical protein
MCVTVVQYSSCQDEMCAGVKNMCNTVKFSNAVLMCLVSSVMFDDLHIISRNTHFHQLNNSCISYWPSGVISHES